MEQATSSLYQCPVCEQRLKNVDKRLICENNHSFDRHKKGYINLLLAHHKNSKAPGDNTDMVNGRRAFLRAGYYQPFADAIVTLMSDYLTSTSPTIVDAGCGEGYYTEALQTCMTHSTVHGFDISKPAIHAAATNKQIQWSVASSHRPPFVDHCMDAVVSIFSPIEQEAFYRILKPGGYVLYAAPSNNHLRALREIIYDEVRDYTVDKHHSYFDDRFKKIEQRTVQVPLYLRSHEAVKQLLSMTPHAHRVCAAGYTRLSHTHMLEDTGDFVLYWYQKI